MKALGNNGYCCRSYNAIGSPVHNLDGRWIPRNSLALRCWHHQWELTARGHLGKLIWGVWLLCGIAVRIHLWTKPWERYHIPPCGYIFLSWVELLAFGRVLRENLFFIKVSPRTDFFVHCWDYFTCALSPSLSQCPFSRRSDVFFASPRPLQLTAFHQFS